MRSLANNWYNSTMKWTADFFQRNRQRLAERLSGGLFSVTAYDRLQRSNDTAFAFEQEANFWYLTGIEEPGWKLIYDGTTHHSWLAMPDIDEVHRIFDGGMSAESARTISGVHEVISADELPTLYRRLTRTHSLAYTVDQPSYAESFNFSLNPALHEHKRQLERTFAKVQTMNKELAALRALKQPEEIAAIERAIKTTINAFTHVHEHINDYKTESEIEAEYTYLFRRAGADGHAYDPIVATGKNACTLHYIANNDTVRNKQLVLIDIGARHHGYAADITRTYAKGEPTKRQKVVHDAVREAQAKICQLLGPDLSVEEYQRGVDEIMLAAIVDVGLAKAGDIEALRRYMPHAVSHGLGIDVHDSLGGSRTLQPGMVLTVEPGLYVPDENIGVRIEDDILITRHGARNLSATLSTHL